MTPVAAPGQEARIHAILEEIAEDLWARRRTLEPELASGLAGAALFLGHLSRREGCGQHLHRAAELLTSAVANARAAASPGFFSGYPGLAWAVEHLRREVFPPEAADPNAEVDGLVLDCLGQGPWARTYDLVDGLVGFGVYGLERLPEAGRPILLAVLEHLEARAAVHGPGLAWATPPEELPSLQREQFPTGCLNYGMAHGIPGVLALVAAIRCHGIEPVRCERMLREGMAGLQEVLEAGSSLPTCLPLGQARPPWKAGRIAWCYGDLGASLAVARAASALDRSDWGDLAKSLALRAAARPMEASGVVDAGLCHGAAGNAHLFNRWYQATGEVRFREAARAYLDRTLALRRPGEACAGFLALSREPGPAHRGGSPPKAMAVPCPGLMNGSAGAGLALLAALGGPDPAWDRCLLVS